MRTRQKSGHDRNFSDSCRTLAPESQHSRFVRNLGGFKYGAQGSHDGYCRICYLQPRSYAIVGILNPFTRTYPPVYDMSVRIQLDKPHAHFTNLDLISGIVILSITSNETISLITVKLEGESRTRLAGPTNPRGTYDPYERDQAQLEVHKVSKYPLDAMSLGDIVLSIAIAPLSDPDCLPHARASPGIWRERQLHVTRKHI